MARFVFGDKPETIIRSSARFSAKRVNHILLGSVLEVVDQDGDWLKVDSLGKGNSDWVHEGDVRDTPILKTFFVDVGQGDGAVVESPEGIMLVDGGPSSNFFSFIKHRYKRILKSGQQVEIKAMVVSHPDFDHFNGLTAILKDKRFNVGTIYHNGIIRYDEKNSPPVQTSILAGSNAGLSAERAGWPSRTLSTPWPKLRNLSTVGTLCRRSANSGRLRSKPRKTEDLEMPNALPQGMKRYPATGTMIRTNCSFRSLGRCQPNHQEASNTLLSRMLTRHSRRRSST